MFYKALQKKKNNKKAFTLIELIVVIAIIGVLVAILVPTMTGFVNEAKLSTANANARTIYSIAQAEATFQQVSGEGIPTSATVTAAIADQVGDMDGTYEVTVGADGNVTLVTFTLADGTTEGQYPPAAPAAT